MRRIITFILALSIGFVILEKTAFPLYAQRPLKDLRVGNIFYYFYAQGSLSTGYFFEKVIGDTVILGRRYARVYSDPWRVTSTLRDRLPRNNSTPIDTIRYERATDSAIYEWVPKDSREYVRLRSIPLYKEGDTTFFKSPITNCSNGCRIGLAPRVIGFDLDGNPSGWEFLISFGSGVFVHRYGNNGYGIISVSNNQTGQIRREFLRVGAAFLGSEIYPTNGATINFIQQLDTLLQTSRITVGVRSEQEAAHSLALAPNPVSDEAEVRFSLSSSKRVRLALVDNLGRVLLSIADEQLPSGEHRFPVHAEALANGVYWVRLFADGQVQTVPVVVRR